MQKIRLFVAIAALLCSISGLAQVVEVNRVQGAKTEALGTVRFEQHASGVLITPNLHGLTPGPHGFHLHAKPSCADNGMAAGGHFDPGSTGVHHGPYSDKGHLGDLPVLWVDQEGRATVPVLAPRLKMSDLQGLSLMIHAGGDNYSDKPAKLGGGGVRVGCGVISSL